MRPDELKSVKVTGTPFFLTGNFLVVWLFPPTVAVMSQLYLVVGDFSAAFFGLAYGRTAIYGNKSLEGSSACFFFLYPGWHDVASLVRSPHRLPNRSLYYSGKLFAGNGGRIDIG